MKNYSKAQKYFKKSLSLYQSLLGTDHIDMVPIYNNIGSFYHSIGNYPKALEYQEKILKIELKH